MNDIIVTFLLKTVSCKHPEMKYTGLFARVYIRWPVEWTDRMQEKICPNFSLNRPKFYCRFSDAYKSI